MDDHRFDDLTRALGAGLTRRGTLRSVLGGLAAVSGVTVLAEVSAKPGKGKRAVFIETICPGDPCTPGGTPCHYPEGQTGPPCVCAPSEQDPKVGTCVLCSDSCEGKKCGEYNECGEVCGGCPPEKPFCVVGEHEVSCQKPPYCTPNGEPGPCCSGYHRDGVCCDPNEPGAVAIIVSVEVFNRITVNSPPITVFTTITTPVSNNSSNNNSNNNSSKSKSKSRGGRRRRRRHHHGRK